MRFHQPDVDRDIEIIGVVWNCAKETADALAQRRPAPTIKPWSQRERLPPERRAPSTRTSGSEALRLRVRTWARTRLVGSTFFSATVAYELCVSPKALSRALSDLVVEGTLRILQWERGPSGHTAARYQIQPEGAKPVPTPPRYRSERTGEWWR